MRLVPTEEKVGSLFLVLLTFQSWCAAELPEIGIGPPQIQPDLNQVQVPSAQKAQDLSETLTSLPNFNFTSGANHPRFFQIRGVGETSQFEHSQVNAFGIFYEGIDLSEEASAVPLLGRETSVVTYRS